MTDYAFDDRIEHNRACNQCDAEPGETHRGFDDIARCKATGIQLIQCGGEKHEYKGIWYGEHDGECGPDIWDGEYPGVKQCRELGWMKECTTYDGQLYIGADLNRLVSESRGWDAETQRYVVR